MKTYLQISLVITRFDAILTISLARGASFRYKLISTPNGHRRLKQGVRVRDILQRESYFDSVLAGPTLATAPCFISFFNSHSVKIPAPLQ